MKLGDVPVILASGSPRRIAMLREAGIEPEIIKPQCDETLRLGLTPAQTVMALALRKGLDVLSRLPGRGEPFLLLACDTVVCLDGRVYGKPADPDEAFAMLSAMRGRAHSVFSGVLIYQNIPKLVLDFHDETRVYFKQYSDEELRAYIATGEPFDKAGGYAIQGGFAPYIDHIEGDYDNVVGFPLDLIRKLLASCP